MPVIMICTDILKADTMTEKSNFEKAFASFCSKHQLIEPKDKILATVSGGADSVAMCELFHRHKISFEIAHVNFLLRGKESDEDEKFVAHLSEHYKVPFYKTSFNTTVYAKENKISIEMAARELRYRWFNEIALRHQCSKIAVAHHQGDNLESILLNIVRGTALRGLHGILPRKDLIIRPLLFANKEMILDYLKAAKLSFREDLSNKDTRFQRNFIREKVTPLLKEINPALEKTVAENAEIIARYEKIVDEELEKKSKKIITKEGDFFLVNIRKLKTYTHREVLLYEFLSSFGFNKEQTEAVLLSLASSPGLMFESDSHQLHRDREYFVLRKKQTAMAESISVNEGNTMVSTNMGDFYFSLISKDAIGNALKNPRHAYIDLKKICFPLLLRSWQHGDIFYPYGQKMKKKISDFLNEKKIAVHQKQDCLVLLSQSDIIWVPPFRIDRRYQINDDTKEVLKVELK